MGFGAKTAAVLEVLRIHNVLIAIATTFIGAAAAAKMAGCYFLAPLYSTVFWLAATVVALIAAGGYAINDYYDAPIDAVDKPWRPIPSGRLSPSTVRIIALAFFMLGTLIALAIGFIAMAYAAMVSTLLHEYSRWIKRAGLPGNIIVAFNSASTIIYGGLAIAEAYHDYKLVAATAIPAFYAFLLVLGREFVKGIEDYRGDSVGGVKTLAVLLGPKYASRIASIVLAAVVLLSPLPYMLGYNLAYLVITVVMDALVVYSIHVLLGSRNPVADASKARRYLKIAFALGALAFIVGLA